MTKILSYSNGDDTVELMNMVITKLANMGLVEAPEDCGFQESSIAMHDFEIHVIKKRT